MNFYKLMLLITLATPCVAWAETSGSGSAEQQTVEPYWNQPPRQAISAAITPSCPQYIQTGVWIYRSAEGTHEWALSLTPTVCGRYIDQSETGLMFYEIVRKFGQSSYWTNNRGIINQLICHLLNAREKPQWNLEPFRPYVGFAATADARCNPLTPRPDVEYN